MTRYRINRPNSGMPKWFIECLLTKNIKPHPMWLYVEIGNDDQCWPFIGANNVDGYGRVNHDNKMVLAHRLSYCLSKDYDLIDFKKTGLLVRHICDNPACCNPKHLIEGTDKDNTRDKFIRGRNVPVRGSKNPRSKITEDQVIEIYKSLLNGDMTTKLATKYNVSDSTIDAIKSGTNWGWLTSTIKS